MFDFVFRFAVNQPSRKLFKTWPALIHIIFINVNRHYYDQFTAMRNCS